MRSHLASLVEDFRAHAEETAVLSHRGVRRYVTTYGELAQLAGRFAAELNFRGIAPGDRVVLWGDNSAEWIAAFFGCLLRGVLAVPLDAAGSPAFAQRVLAEVTPKLVVGDAKLLRDLNSALPQLELSQLTTHLSLAPDFTVDPAVTEAAPFQIIFTSGTTAEPKGIVHTHRNVLASLRPIESEIAKYRRYERWFHPLRFLHTLPLSHVFGQFMGLWLPGILAAELHFADTLEPARTVDLIRTQRISVLIAVPRVVGLLRSYLLGRFPKLAEQLDRVQPRSPLRRWWHFRAVHRSFGWKFWAVISGGAALPAELESFWHILGYALVQGYGMTETAALVTLNHPFKIGQGSIGKALPGREIRLSENGEMLVRGDMVSAATWQNGVMRPRESEWLATGDLAEQSPNGDFRFLGRKGEAIVTASGLNIFPSDIESALLRQPGVRACAVVPCELPAGIEPVCVVLFSDDDAAMQAAVRAANLELADYQQIRRALRWPQLDFPYTSTGKLLRRQIRDWASATLQQNQPAPMSDPLLSLMAEITGMQPASGNDDLRLSEDLGLDSLGRVQLAASLQQRLGTDLGEEQLAQIATLGELRAATGVQSSKSHAEMPPPVASSAETIRPSQREHIYPHWPWSWPLRTMRTIFVELILRPLVALFLAPKVVSTAALPNGPLLIVSNHVTVLDAPLLLYALPPHLRRRLAVAMSGEMLLDFRSFRGWDGIPGILAPLAYWLATALFNVFPMPRLQGFRRSFAHAGEAMDRGFSVLVFPEGALSHGAAMAHFRQGIGLLAAQAGVPVLPVALLGQQTLATKWFRNHKLEVRIGAPMKMPEGDDPAAWTQTLEAELRRLLESATP